MCQLRNLGPLLFFGVEFSSIRSSERSPHFAELVSLGDSPSFLRRLPNLRRSIRAGR